MNKVIDQEFEPALDCDIGCGCGAHHCGEKPCLVARQDSARRQMKALLVELRRTQGLVHSDICGEFCVRECELARAAIDRAVVELEA